MHILSLFPSLFTWALLAPTLIRLTLGLVFLYWGYRGMQKKNTDNLTKGIALLEGVAGILVFVGFWTQGAALYIALDLVVRIIQHGMKTTFFSHEVSYYVILLVLAISLLVLGAGFFAFDLSL